MPRLLIALAIATAAGLASCCGCGSGATAEQTPQSRKLEATLAKLRPLHTPLGEPLAGDWLASHEEAGQTFAQYLASRPVTPQGRRRVIYVLPLGDFSETERKIVDLTADYMSRYFNRPVKFLDAVPLSAVPAAARRTHPTWGDKQILSTYVLDDLLPDRLPADGAALIAFTSSDLWPGRGWNFVFGQASLRNRVGVWSIYRNGDPDQDAESFRLCLLRTIKTAVHETGHMFSMKHCTAYECVMCGSNNRTESDRRPVAACVECLGKVCWATEADPSDRYTALAQFCNEQGLAEPAKFFEKSLKQLAE